MWGKKVAFYKKKKNAESYTLPPTNPSRRKLSQRIKISPYKDGPVRIALFP